jgi:hypothetical protein
MMPLNGRRRRIVLRIGSASVISLGLAACANNQAFETAQPAQAMQNPAAERMDISDAKQGFGYGRALMGDLIDAGNLIGIERIKSAPVSRHRVQKATYLAEVQ